MWETIPVLSYFGKGGFLRKSVFRTRQPSPKDTAFHETHDVLTVLTTVLNAETIITEALKQIILDCLSVELAFEQAVINGINKSLSAVFFEKARGKFGHLQIIAYMLFTHACRRPVPTNLGPLLSTYKPPTGISEEEAMEETFRRAGHQAGYADEVRFSPDIYTSLSWDKAYEKNSIEYGHRLDCRISFATDGQALMLFRPEGKGQAHALIATATELCNS